LMCAWAELVAKAQWPSWALRGMENIRGEIPDRWRQEGDRHPRRIEPWGSSTSSHHKQLNQWSYPPDFAIGRNKNEARRGRRQ
jgi:hypothetical protein